MKKISRRVQVFVDAEADGVARVLLGEEILSLPTRLLPEGAGEGDWIDLSARVIPAPPAAGKDAARRRARLVADDPGGPIKL